MRGRVCPPRQSRPQASSMEPGEACEPPKGGFRGCNWPKPVSQVSALLGDYLVSCKDQGGYPKSKKQLVHRVQIRAKSLWVSGFPERPPSRYCLVLPRTSSTPAPFSSSSEAESAHHQQSRQCQCKVTWCCFGLLPSLGVGSGGVGGRPSASKLPRSSHKGPRWQQRSAPIRRLLIPCYYTAFIRS